METTVIFKKELQQICINDQIKQLTKIEVAIMDILLKNQNMLVKKEDILIPIWGKTDYYKNRSMDVHICNLRKVMKLANISIENKHGIGFTLHTNDIKIMCE